eukprot:gene12583-15807_t
MLEVYEVFDASNDELVSELGAVRAALHHAQGFDRAKLLQLEDVIGQELEERGCSQAVYQQLIPPLPPPPASPKPATREESPHSSAQITAASTPTPRSLAARSAPGPLPSPTPASQPPFTASSPFPSSHLPPPSPFKSSASPSSPSPKPSASIHSQNQRHHVQPQLHTPHSPPPPPSPAPLPAPTMYNNYDPEPSGPPKSGPRSRRATESETGGAEGEDGEDDDEEDMSDGDDEVVNDTPAPESAPMSVLEAAMLAFKQEQMQLRRARVAVKRKPKKGAPPAARAAAPPRAPAFAPPIRPAAHQGGAQPSPSPQSGPKAATAIGNNLGLNKKPGPLQHAPASHAPPSNLEQVICTPSPTSVVPETPEDSPMPQQAYASARQSLTSPQATSSPRVAHHHLQHHAASPRPASAMSSSEYDSEEEERERRERREIASHSHRQSDLATKAARGQSLAPAPPGSRFYETARIQVDESGGGLASDRWQDWDIMGKEKGVSEWGKSKDEDEMVTHIREAVAQRDARYAPPAIVELASGLEHHRSTRGPEAHASALGKAVGATGSGSSYKDSDMYSSVTSTITVATNYGGGRQKKGGWDEFDRELNRVEGAIPEEDEEEEEEEDEDESYPAPPDVHKATPTSSSSRSALQPGSLSSKASSVAGRSAPTSASRPTITTTTTRPTSATTRPTSATSTPPKGSFTTTTTTKQPPSQSNTSSPARGSASPPVRSTQGPPCGPSFSQRDPSPPAATIVGAAYMSYFTNFSDIMSLCYTVLTHLSDSLKHGMLSSRPGIGIGIIGSGLGLGSIGIHIGIGTGGIGSIGPGIGSSQLSAAFNNLDVSEKYQGMVLRCTAWLEQLARRRAEAAEILVKPSVGLRPKGVPASLPVNIESWESGVPPNYLKGDFSSGTQPLVSSMRYLAVADDTLHCEVKELVSSMRYLAVADDTLHSEVREVMKLAFQDEADWELDPIDQVTEEAQADSAGVPQPITGVGSLSHTGTLPASMSNQVIAGRPGTLPASMNNQVIAGRPGTSQRLAGRCHMWNLMWSWSVKMKVPFNDLMIWQKVNHFPEAKQLTRKDLLKRHLVKYQVMHGGGKLGAQFDILPTTYTLPKEMDQFVDAFNRALHMASNSRRAIHETNLWITKPIGLSRGRGISLISSLKQAVASIEEPMVMQRYITDPLLIQGYKFDLRLYVGVTSFNPLEAWISRDGFARFSTVPYTLDEAQLDNRMVHLTNASVQKERSNKNDLPDFLRDAEVPGGSKCSLATLQTLLAKQGVRWDKIWQEIHEVVTVALFAAQDAIPHCVNSFELFGFDVMMDSSLKVWLIEVNSSPSLSIDTPLDRVIKPRVVRDLVKLVDPLAFHREGLLEVLDKRLSSKGRLTRRGAGLLSGTTSVEKEAMCSHLHAVLRGGLPRRHGEAPRCQGSFECLSSSPLIDKLYKLKKPLG